MNVRIQKVRKHKVSVSFDRESYVLEDELFGIYVRHNTILRLMLEYWEELMSLVLLYGIEEDDKLTPDAIELKKKVNRYLKYDLY